ncbi:MAG: DUF2147 domain-containing protein [Roseiarcus sp.]
MLRRSLLIFAAVAASSQLALAADVVGEWMRDNGEAKVRFSPCGAAVCGRLSWLRDSSGPAKVGQQVFFDMKPSGDNVWAGLAFNPDDGQNYTSKITLSNDTLLTAGCVFGGWICKSVAWTRSR